jgi:hypothetical protein
MMPQQTLRINIHNYNRHYATNPQVAGSIPDGVIEIFLRSHYEYQVYFLGVKAADA